MTFIKYLLWKKTTFVFLIFYFKFGFYTLKIVSRPNFKTFGSILAEIKILHNVLFLELILFECVFIIYLFIYLLLTENSRSALRKIKKEDKRRKKRRREWLKLAMIWMFLLSTVSWGFWFSDFSSLFSSILLPLHLTIKLLFYLFQRKIHEGRVLCH